MYIVTQNSYTVDCQLVADSGQTVADSNVHSETEQLYGRLSVSGRQWRDCNRQQCT